MDDNASKLVSSWDADITVAIPFPTSEEWAHVILQITYPQHVLNVPQMEVPC